MRFLVDRLRLAVVAAKSSCGAPRGGAEKSPKAIIQTGLFDEIRKKANVTVVFDEVSYQLGHEGITSPNSDKGMKNPLEVSEVTKRISNSVSQQARLGRFVLTLGGDHSIGIGTVSGTAKAIRERLPGQDLGVLWIDAHADINTPETSLSGRLHGMPVAFVSGLAKPLKNGIFDWLQQDHLIILSKFVYIGLRDVDEAEVETIEKHGIKAFTMEDIKLYGIDAVMDLALDHIGSNTPIHASYDIDSLDPEWAPSTGFPVASGLSLREGLVIAKRLHESRNLVALDLVEINPDISTLQIDVTLRSGCALIKNALGVA